MWQMLLSNNFKINGGDIQDVTIENKELCNLTGELYHHCMPTDIMKNIMIYMTNEKYIRQMKNI